MIPPRHSRGLAFTLIELLVVVAIITVLIAILLPSLGKAREKAKLTVCQTHMRGWGQGFIMYATDYNGQLPLDGGDGTAAVPIGQWNDPYLWFNGVTSYTANQTYDSIQENAILNHTGTIPKGGANSMFVCPSAGTPEPGSGDVMTSMSGNPPYPDGYFLTSGWYAVATTGAPFAEQRPMLLCYGMNSKLRVGSEDPNNPWGTNYDTAPTGLNDVRNITLLKPAALVPLLAEKRISPNELPNTNPPYPNFTKGLAQSKLTATRFAARHDKGGNIVFADGHVEWMLNSVVSNPNKALPANYYNIPGLIVWNPNGPH